MRYIKTTLFALFLSSSLSFTALADAKPLTVVELFTSQGCSSCPPADEFAGELTKRDDVLPLSFNVDYWNYIGWNDPFSSPEKTQRQKDYARSLGLRNIYTPQVVINGTTETVGSHRRTILSMINSASKAPQVSMQLADNGKSITASVGKAVHSANHKADIILVVFDNKRETDIRRGENAGRKLAYYNVVNSFKSVGQWQGATMQIKLDKLKLAQHGNGMALLLQQPDTGTILGAARLSLQ
ncbi:MAG: DUF1223 domain-containing protein [Alphaproteobacteria bacterium]|nr:DUF1223 domain-containing protein [Rhodospirillales bacterium]MCW9045622.1 DUF1223 domain-containing protein [Alphaproteobacteria bacterium]